VELKTSVVGFFSFPTTDEGKGVDQRKRKQAEVANAHDNGEDVQERGRGRRPGGGACGARKQRVHVGREKHDAGDSHDDGLGAACSTRAVSSTNFDGNASGATRRCWMQVVGAKKATAEAFKTTKKAIKQQASDTAAAAEEQLAQDVYAKLQPPTSRLPRRAACPDRSCWRWCASSSTCEARFQARG
jgi:hypothetical protein